jgi:hypothetical protein
VRNRRGTPYELKKESLARLAKAFETARDMFDPPAPQVLYHFCTHETALNILKSRALWACDLRASRNDPHELDTGIEILRNALSGHGVIEAIGPNLAEDLRETCLHVSCLSGELNLRSQWNEYANAGAGCALGFRLEDLHRVCLAQDIFHFRMIYDPNIQFSIYDRFLGEADKIPWSRLSAAGSKACYTSVIVRIATLAHRSKHLKFSSENEWRLFVNCDDRYERVDRKICTRVLPICKSETLCEVIMGPENCNSQTDLERLLRNSCYDRTEVRRIDSQQLV